MSTEQNNSKRPLRNREADIILAKSAVNLPRASFVNIGGRKRDEAVWVAVAPAADAADALAAGAATILTSRGDLSAVAVLGLHRWEGDAVTTEMLASDTGAVESVVGLITQPLNLPREVAADRVKWTTPATASTSTSEATSAEDAAAAELARLRDELAALKSATAASTSKATASAAKVTSRGKAAGAKKATAKKATASTSKATASTSDGAAWDALTAELEALEASLK